VNYLLDTHVLLWGAFDNKRLGRKTRNILTNASGVHFTSISVAEINLKSKLKLEAPASEIIQLAVQEGLQELGFSSLHAEQIPRFGSLTKHDPFDRLILAQAAAEGMTLLTADETLLELGFGWLLDART
jgi:PIN domain nuclease of toxin-antitoxin system